MKLTMKTSKQEILNAYNESQETITQLQTNAWKVMLFNAIATVSAYMLSLIKEDNLAKAFKAVAYGVVPLLVYLYCCGEWTGQKAKSYWSKASNALVLEPMIN